MPGEAGLVNVATAETRIDAISERLALLQAQTDGLARRAVDAAERARLVRVAVGTCSHATEVAEMQQALGDLEREIEGLRTAMQTRGLIEQAKGMLMLQRRCDAEEAFAMLVELSQTSHRKLVEVASTLVATWSAGDA